MDVQSIVPQISATAESLRAGLAAGRLDSHYLSKVDGDVALIEGTLLRLKFVRNAAAPFLRLPQEVVTEIAEHLAIVWPSRCSLNVANEYYPRSRLNWVKLSHICTTLRGILLGYPQLWARLICDIPIQPTTTLTRCGGLPLTLSLRSTSPPFMIAFALEHLDRARTIDIREMYHGLDRDRGSDASPNKLHIRQFSQSIFPYLEHMKVELSYGGSDYQTTADTLALPPMVAPRLKSLHLIDFMIPFLPDTLTTLTLQSHLENVEFRIPPERLLDLMRRCLALEHLNVMSCLSILPVEQSQTPLSITLPCLQYMLIEDRIETGLSLWGSLCTPRLRTMLAIFTGTNVRNPAHSSHLSLIAPRLRDMGSDIKGVSLYDWSDIGVERSAVTLVLHSVDPGNVIDEQSEQDRHSKLKICLYSVDTSAPHFINALDTVSANIDCSPIKLLRLGCLHDYPSSVWSTSFARFSNIRLLALQEMPRTHALVSLLYPTASPEESERPPVIFPALEYLWLSTLDLQGFDPDAEEFVDSGIDEARFERILSSRAECGFAIKHLRIDKLLVLDLEYVRNTFLPRLREIVPTVECENLEE